MLTWTIGSGGLIGSAVAAAASRGFVGAPTPWSDQREAMDALTRDLGRFTEAAGNDAWAIVWAAGAATTSSDDATALAEAEFFRKFVERMADAVLPRGGRFFLCSSAGGVHAGSQHPPFTDSTPPAPIGPYGRARLAQEEAATEVLGPLMPVTIGRISNVYGPGQKLDKLQGLISRLAVSAITREPLNLFVPLSTVRDYMYVSDVARSATTWIEASVADPHPGAHIRLIASGQGTSVGQLVRLAQGVAHRKVPIAMGSHPSSSLQAADLRFIPTPLPEGSARATTPLPVGMKRVFDDIRWRLQQGAA